MKKTVLLYGIALASLTALLKTLEYQYFIRSLSLEMMMGALAAFFTVFGVWIGRKITAPRPRLHPYPADLSNASVSILSNSEGNSAAASRAGITNRELEVLELMAQGCSNQEIADRLFVSLSTVKTHSSNLYSKLEAKRRTQAIQKAKTLEYHQLAFLVLSNDFELQA